MTYKSITDHVSFHSWRELLDFASDAPQTIDTDNQSRHTIKDGYKYLGDDFYGTSNWETAIGLARNGWSNIGTDINKLSSLLFDRVSRYCLRPETAYATEGVNLDTGRWLEGEPEHWLVQADSEDLLARDNRVVRILYNTATSSAVSAKTMQAKGTVVVSLIRLLDYVGIRTELWLTKVLGLDKKCLLTVPVKLASQDLDMDIVAFALAHPSCNRRIMFSVMERCDKRIWDTYFSHSYGIPNDIDSIDLSPNDIYIPKSRSGDPQWTDPALAEAWILDHLAKCGVQLKRD